VRGADFAAVALTLALAALSIADVVYLNLHERQAELVTLRTLGWTNRHLRTTILLESLGLGLLGSLTGALLALTVGTTILTIPALSLTLAALAAGTTAATLAALAPLSQINQLTTPQILAAE
jgi:putative ABC transport system permease protein